MSDEAYTGVDNLEVLAAAERYNAFLVREVLAAAAKADRALDFGAGIGTFARRVRATGLQVACVEPDPDLLEHLRSEGFEAFASLQPVPDASFDYAYTLNVLEHIDDDQAALDALHRVVRPGGRLFVYVPAFEVLFSAMDAKVGHVRRYRRGQLVERVQRAGFVVERAAYVDSLGFLASLAYKAVGSRQGDLSEGPVRFYDRVVFPVSRVLDRVFGRVAGKNVLLVARRPG